MNTNRWTGNRGLTPQRALDVQARLGINDPNSPYWEHKANQALDELAPYLFKDEYDDFTELLQDKSWAAIYTAATCKLLPFQMRSTK